MKIKTVKAILLFEVMIVAALVSIGSIFLFRGYGNFIKAGNESMNYLKLMALSEEKIWNHAVEDSVGLETFYQKNNKKYLWEERFKGSVIICKDKVTREEAEKFLAAGMTTEEIVDQLNLNEKMITIDEGTWEKGSNPIVDYFVWNEEEPKDFNGNVTFIRGNKIPPEPKTLDEARGLYISQYQNNLEKNWLKELRKKYKTIINKKLLKTIEGV